MIAAQLYEKMKVETPNWEELIEKGELSFIMDFMEVLHRQAATKDFKGTIHTLFGTDLSHHPLLGYLDERYGKCSFT
jgi:Zn-dependent M32 family carboxypeptidase